jgi:hypothetical protein
MTMHELKCWPEYFQATFIGLKKFDLRRNDRGFKVGDMIKLREYEPPKPQVQGERYAGPIGTYTGRVLHQRICYMLEGVGGSETGVIAPLKGLERGFVILGYMDTNVTSLPE